MSDNCKVCSTHARCKAVAQGRKGPNCAGKPDGPDDCDCLDICGSDKRIANGTATPCASYLAQANTKAAASALANDVTAINVFIEIDGKHCIALIDPAKAEIFLGMLPVAQHGEKQSAELVTLPDSVTKHLLNTRRAILEHVQRAQRQPPPTEPRP